LRWRALRQKLRAQFTTGSPDRERTATTWTFPVKHRIRVSVAAFALAALSLTPTGCGKKEPAAEAKPADPAAAAAAPAAGEAKPAEAAPAAPAVAPEATIAEQTQKVQDAKTADEALSALEAALTAANWLKMDEAKFTIPDGEPRTQLIGAIETIQFAGSGYGIDAEALKTRLGETLGKFVDSGKSGVQELVLDGRHPLIPRTPERLATFEEMAKDASQPIAHQGLMARFGYSVSETKPEDFAKLLEVIAGMQNKDYQEVAVEQWAGGLKPDTAATLADWLATFAVDQKANKMARTKAVRQLVQHKAKPQLEKLKAEVAKRGDGAFKMYDDGGRKMLDEIMTEGLK
jgi:hypothetical protein